MKKAILLFAGLAILTFKNQAQTVTDYDGNVYSTITIGSQIWMQGNLKVTHYRNGDAITNVTNFSNWWNLTTGAYCNYNNDVNNATTYGILYNWHVVNDSRNIAPAGWHVPTDAEWTILTTFLGGENVAGGKLKETGINHWLSPNNGATNESGFTALPGGYRDNTGTFSAIGVDCFWWSSSENSPYGAWSRRIDNISPSVNRLYSNESNGFSVRCLKDLTTQNDEFNYQKEIKIYPNPSINKTYINCAEIQNIKMQIYNMVGECVLQRELSSGTNEIDISSLSKGIYIIQLTGADKIIRQKLIKD
jgi:uncharacterized protein (TIGR02145 family)